MAPLSNSSTESCTLIGVGIRRAFCQYLSVDQVVAIASSHPPVVADAGTRK